MLAQSYRHLGMNDKAQAAYARAVEFGYDASRLDDQLQQASKASKSAAPSIAVEPVKLVIDAD